MINEFLTVLFISIAVVILIWAGILVTKAQINLWLVRKQQRREAQAYFDAVAYRNEHGKWPGDDTSETI